ncbi:hypothetical protein GGE24_005562 [Bradyrhizobium centrosematis]|nr:hypothetical protein [Bradyrhizobium centrosematis]MCS3764742.1 hypothetical protein [Bradyrhizobium centrosematis]MCS3776206.1 hypothetical protein [Bradyrhizobium centrosematis]
MILDQPRSIPARRRGCDHELHEPFGIPVQQNQRPQLKIQMLEITVRQPMVDVEEAVDAARASVLDGGVLEPAASRAFQRGMRTAGRVDLITPATEGVVDVTTHGPADTLERA